MVAGLLFKRERVAFKILIVVPIVVQSAIFFCLAEQPAILRVIKPEASLHRYNDAESETIGSVQAGDEVTLKIEAFGQTTWYLVETVSGQVGWLRSSDVEPPIGVEPAANEEETQFQFGPGSTWWASTNNGRTLGGTWAGSIDISTGIASGSWAVVNGTNRVILQGTWSAIRKEREWLGSWRASVNGQSREYSGTWVSGLTLDLNLTFDQLFKEAVNKATNGIWQSEGQSGSWSIRVMPRTDL